MCLKKFFSLWACMGMLCLDGWSQTVSWGPHDGSVTVTNGTYTLSTYIATTDDEVRKYMTYFNVSRVWSPKKPVSYAPLPGEIEAEMQTGGYVKLQVFEYDNINRTKGALLYGIYTNESGNLGKAWTENEVPSDDMQQLLDGKTIYCPPSLTVKSIIYYPGLDADTRQLINWGASKEVLAATKDFAHVTLSGAGLFSEMDSTANVIAHLENKDKKEMVAETPVYCRQYLTPFQPVVIELSITNATVYHIRFPELKVPNTTDVSYLIDPATPYSLFHIWNNTDYSHLFRCDRCSIMSHRGYWRSFGVAQNSLAAIQAAADRPDVDAIELDVRSSSDKKAICFHDDKPQKILQKTSTDYPTASVYDLSLDILKNYKLYDRFDKETSEYLLTLENAFKYIRDHQITKPINLDIGIPDSVPVGGAKTSGKPYFDAVFLQAVGAACRYGLTDRIIFKGKYGKFDPIWQLVRDTLVSHPMTVYTTGGKGVDPIIAYTPKLGDDIADPQNYLSSWISPFKLTPWIAVVGMEVRVKNDESTTTNTFLNSAIGTIQSKKYAADSRLRVGIFSETPTSCQGYWTKSAVESYVDFSKDYRNNFDWLLNKNYDYIITDMPELLSASLNARQ
jgi:hypothetical protein